MHPLPAVCDDLKALVEHVEIIGRQHLADEASDSLINW
jgi:hypothetical protein